MYGAKKITLQVPYFGYSTMERAVKTGEVVKAKTRQDFYLPFRGHHSAMRSTS